MADKTLLEQELKNRIPEFQRDNETFDQFLEAVGAYLDHIKDEIESLSYINDYQRGTSSNVVNTFEQENIDYPLTLSEELTRLIVRDMAQLYSIKGTERTMEWILKALGVGVTIRHAWILNPKTFVVPDPIDTSTFIYGRERVYENGVYFDGEDIFGNDYSKTPIIGEKYPVNRKFSENDIGKTPYIFLNITLDDYVQFGKDVGVTNESGLDDIILGFFDTIRPANVVAILLITTPDFEDEIPFKPIDAYDDTDLEYPIIDDGTWQMGNTLNHYRFGEYFTTPSVGDHHEYIRNREDLDPVPQDDYDVVLSSANDARWTQIRDHAVVKLHTRLVSGSVSVNFSDSVRSRIVNNTASWEEFYNTSWSVDEGYETDAFGLGTNPFGSQAFAASSDEEGSWIQERHFKELFIDQSGLQVEFSSDINGYVDMDIHYFSMLHPIINSNKFETTSERASTALNINDAGVLESTPTNQLREAYTYFDSGYEPIGYLIEEEATNLITQSQSLTSSRWVQFDAQTLLSSSTLFIDGSSMFMVRRTASLTNFAGIRQTVTGIEEGQRYSASVYVRRGNASRMSFYVEQGDRSSIVSFNPTSMILEETVGASTFQNTSMFFERVGEEIYRIIFRFDAASTENVKVSLLADIDNTTDGQYTFFTGAQLERGDPSSYIRTQLSTVSRSSDDVLVDPFPNILEQSGVVLIDCSTISDEIATVFEISNGVSFFKVDVDEGSIRANGSTLFNTELKQFVYENNFFIVLARSGDNVLYWIEDDHGNRTEGSMPYTSMTGALQMSVGSDINKQNHLNGTIRNVYFSTDDYSGELKNWIRDILIQYRTLQHK